MSLRTDATLQMHTLFMSIMHPEISKAKIEWQQMKNNQVNK